MKNLYCLILFAWMIVLPNFSPENAFRETYSLSDSLRLREQQSSARELTTIFEMPTLQEELIEQAAQVKVCNTLLVCGGVVFLVLLVQLVREVQYARTIRDMNSRMVKTIQELLSYREKWYKAEELVTAVFPVTTPPASSKNNVDEKNTATENPQQEINTKEKENSVLFRQLDRIVTAGQLFTQQDFAREDLMKCIGVDKNRLARILQQNACTNVAGYLNNKRMEYAVELLKAHPEYNIATVANMCGMSISSFNRMFKSKYKMTPKDFKCVL